MLLVHIAGTADLGIPLKKGHHKRTPEDIEHDLTSRLAELNSQRNSSDISSRLLELNFDHQIDIDTDEEDASTPPGSALKKEIRALSKLATKDVNQADILIIGAKGERTPTDQLAHSLAHQLSKIADDISTLAGVDDIHIESCILPDLTVNQASTELLEQAIGLHDGHILLSVGVGASKIFSEAAGVAASTHPDDWSLVLIDRTADEPDTQAVPPLIDMSVHTDPARGWLMGLGLPTILKMSSPTPDEEVNIAAEAVERVMGESNTSPTPHDFAQMVLADVSRGDLAAGMAVRSWIIAEYRRRLQEYNDSNGLNISDVSLASKGKPLTVGKAIGRAKRNPCPPNDWLAAQSDLNNLGVDATHHFGTPSSATDSSQLLDIVRHALGEPPSWLSWPSEQVCFLTTKGLDGRLPLIDSLLLQPPAEIISRSCSVPPPLQVNTFIACSEKSWTAGHDVAKDIRNNRLDRHPSWKPTGNGVTTVVNYGPSTTDNGAQSHEIEATMRDLKAEAISWIAQLPKSPRAIIVTNLGEKAIFITLLQAAQEFGSTHGIPVFLASKEDNSASLQFHQLGLDKDTRQALLDATEYCLNRFDLLSASRLLALGSPEMGSLSNTANELANQLVEAVNATDLDSFAGTVLGAMEAASNLIAGLPSDAQARIITIIAELVNIPDHNRPKGFIQPRVMANSKNDSGKTDLKAESAAHLLGLLVRARNKLPITHGSQSLAEIMPTVLKNYQQRDTCTYPALLRFAINAVEAEHNVSAGDWGRRFHSLRGQVKALGKTGDGEKP